MVEFANAMQQAGISPPANILADGTLHRFHVEGDRTRSENGWYVLFDEGVKAGSFGCWKRGIQETWSQEEYKPFTPEEKAQYRANMETQKRQREAEQERIHAECREQSEIIWKKSGTASKEHSYTLIKGLNGNYGVREYRGSLVVPVRDSEGTLHGLQFILPENNEAGLDKYFKSGTNKKGHYHSIGGKPESVLYLAEGYATAATIYEATGEPVAVCFDAGNLKPVAEVLRSKFPDRKDRKIVICADNDSQTEGNPGLAKGSEAAAKIGGLLAVPEFPEGVTGSDFNDLAAVVGLDEVKRQIEAAAEPIIYKSDMVATANPAIIAINNEWPELLPLQAEIEQLEYPIDSLPNVIGDAVRSYHEYGQQPLPIIANSALANISLACQCHCDVARDNALTGPISLFFLSIAESGERKTTVDKAFGNVARQWLREQQHQASEKIKELTPRVRGWEAIETGLINQLKNKSANREKIQAELDQHYLNKVQLPKLPELFLSDTNQASLMNEISSNAFYGCSLWDDEGGNIVGGNGTGSDNVTAYFSIINKLWDGSQTTQKRTGGNRRVEGRRLTANIMVQEAVAKQLINGNKGLSRGSGLLARFMITSPESTMGTRKYRVARDLPALEAFGVRTVELLRHGPSVDEYDRLDLPLLHPDSTARNIWQDFYNDTEETLKPYGEFATVKDVVSKIADNAIRIAANLHVFQFGVTGKINAETMTQATMIALFHLTEARRTYGMIGSDSTERQDAIKLLDWMTSRNFEATSKSTIMQRGPNPLRSKVALDPVLGMLCDHGITRVTGSGKAQTVEVNPEYIARRNDDQSC